MEFSAVNSLWLLIGAVLVFFMQAGFAMVETGFTRAKNAGNIIMKNLMDFACGSIVFWIIGFGLMFAGTGKLIGGLDFFIQGDYSAAGEYPTWIFVIFQTVFCATAATIVSGAMAERTKFKSYLLYSIAISAVVYPISGHWIWAEGGWLAELGFIDLAGSTAVHMVGGVAALVGAKILGPRIGKYSKSGKPRVIPGHSLTLGALGVFILWFCWFGFNGASTYDMASTEGVLSTGLVFMNTNMAAAVSTVTVMIITWIRYKKPDVSMTLNGSLAGLVAVTAGCAEVNPFGAACIGLIAGFVVVFAVEFIDKVLKIDDPVGAIAVHGCCGAVGTLLIGLFAVNGGLFYGGGVQLLGIQALGVVSVIAWVAVSMTIVFMVIKKTIGLRASKEEEIKGLDSTEHGLVSAYADFTSTDYIPASSSNGSNAPQGSVPVDDAVPVQIKSGDSIGASDVKLTKVEIVTNQSKFEVLKDALSQIGVTGMTVTNVLGCGMQKGIQGYYRGIPVDGMHVLPKIQVEIVVAKVPVSQVVEVAKKVLYTGNIGDGKIFIYDVENVVKIRTGEQGYEALQGEDD